MNIRAFAILFLFVSLLTQQVSASGTNSSTDDSKPDMTELFGPDYKKGDIGHSFGVINTITAAGNLVIEHGKIHGTDIEATTTELEVLSSADLAELIENSRVEFLVKKGHDHEYRVLSICKITTENPKCL